MAQYYYSNGKRKNAIARVRLYQDGGGKLTVNEHDPKAYFSPLQIENAIAPLRIANLAKTFDIAVQVLGGGKSAQSDAVRLGISRALLLHDPELRPTLKREGFLRRDARIKERKKPGLKRARRAPQFSKR
ncbi:MAG: 30S ribosomal protein S9 [Candidatus Binatia bacterium]|nr:30S ribosomal protein S9 [Candidatus Binatia bacterium]